MSNNGATLVKRGTGAAGEQPNGIVAQYQLTGKNASATVGPYDSGTILGSPRPGQAAAKLVSGVIQNATDLICNVNPLGNTLPSTAGSGKVPTVNPAQATSAGLSLNPDHE